MCLLVEEKDSIHWQIIFVSYASSCSSFKHLEPNKCLQRKYAGHTSLSRYYIMTNNRWQKRWQTLISDYKPFAKQIMSNYNFISFTFIMHQGIEIDEKFKIGSLVYVRNGYMSEGLILSSGNNQQFTKILISAGTYSNCKCY